MTMRAACYTGNKTFSVMQKPAPENIGADDVEIDVAFCGICGTDLHIYLGHMDARVGFERTIGHEMSGTISRVGSHVEGMSEGQKVVVRPLEPCHNCPACDAGHHHICHNLKFLGIDTDGAFQDKWVVPAHTVHLLPDDMDLSHAALIEPLAVACHDVNRAQLQAGEDVLVIGGGPIGLLVALVARQAGGNVRISEVNDSRLAYAEKLGFDTYDPRKTDVAAQMRADTNGKGAEVIFEVSGTQAGVDVMTQTAAARGRIVMVAIHAEQPRIDMFKFFWQEIELLGARVYLPEDYEQAMQLLSKGVVDCDGFITDIQPLEDIQTAFDSLAGNPQAIKSMIQINR